MRNAIVVTREPFARSVLASSNEQAEDAQSAPSRLPDDAPNATVCVVWVNPDADPAQLASADHWEAQRLLAENSGSMAVRLTAIKVRCILAGYTELKWHMDFTETIGLNLAARAGAVGKANPGDLH